MDVTLSPQIERLIRRQIESGRFRSAVDVIEEALRLLDERDRSATLEAELNRGFAQLDRGEGAVWKPGSMDRLQREATENSRRRKPVKDAVKP